MPKRQAAGAAGGPGYAFRAYLNGELKPGAEIVLDEIGIDKGAFRSGLALLPAREG